MSASIYRISSVCNSAKVASTCLKSSLQPGSPPEMVVNKEWWWQQAGILFGRLQPPCPLRFGAVGVRVHRFTR